MQTISGSVGQGGRNTPNDVRIVQNLLNQALRNSSGFQTLAVDGIVGPKTIAAIKMYQTRTFGWNDGRVDPNGRTITSLSQSPGSPTGPASPSSSPGAAPVVPGTYTDSYRQTPNISSYKIAPKYIVLHHSAGTFNGDISWILNSQSQVSYHYLINEQTGNRVQFCTDNSRAWHAGVSSWNGLRGMNSHSIGIAFTGNTNSRSISDTEAASCAEKCKELMNKFGIPKSNILTHQMIAPNRKNDCSRAAYEKVLSLI